MQFNLIAQLSAAPPSAPATASNDAPSEDKGFSKMLDDAGAKGGSGQGKRSLPRNESKAAALSAQEASQTQPAPLPGDDTAQSLLGKVITPDEAKAILARLDGKGEQGKQDQDPLFEQLKEKLEEIAEGTEPVDLGGIVEALPDIAEAQPSERSPALHRLLGWVSAALEKHKEAPAASTVPDGTVQSLQASLFSAGHDAAKPAPETAPAQSDRDEENIAVSAAATNAATQVAATVAVIVPAAQSLAMPEWVKKLGEGEENIATDAINEAIPPLALPEEEEGLPVVTLPGSEDVEAAATKGSSKSVAHEFRDMLEAHAATANDESDSMPVVHKEAGDSAAAVQVAQPAQAQPAASAAANPITVSAHSHLAPHLAAAEQVHVAITSMKKEDITSITMQLEPADLGRVEIKMDTIDGRTNLSFVVDKPETLDALSRDARSLERQLQEAGIRADAGSMQFNLRQQPQQQQEQAGLGSGKGRDGRAVAGADDVIAPEGAMTRHYTLNVKEGVDIHA